MNASKLSTVRIAVKEAPQTISGKGRPRSEHSIVVYPTECPNSLVVGGNVYNFDYAFRPTVGQKQLYHELIQPLVEKVLAGIDCTALAYGQTGTGKSYSMGLAYTQFCEEQHLGIAPRCLKEILEKLSQDQENRFVSPQVFASFIEIYNEKAYDLLQNTSTPSICSRGQRFGGGTLMPIRCQRDLHHLLILGTQNRHVRPTNMNENSSRSHAILTIYIKRSELSNLVRFNIVDLAGSEGVRRTGHEGVARQEGVHINQGLLSINKVLMSMSAGQDVIPYRDSVLTTVLQESLNARSFLTLLACISPHACDLSETNSTLRFAKSAKRLKLTRNQSNLIQMNQQHRRLAVATTSATPAAFRRLLPSSTTIKRIQTIRPAGLSSFCTPKNQTNTLYRARSEMGLTPKAKEKVREQLHNMEQIPLIEVSTVSNAEFPTYADYLDLKMKKEALQRQLDSIRKQPLGQAPTMLSFGDSNSTLCSITEEESVVNNAPPKHKGNYPLFTSSPTNLTGIVSLSMISDINSVDSTIVNEPVEEAAVAVFKRPKVSRMARLKANNETLINSIDLVQPRRSTRIAMRTQQNLSQCELALEKPGTKNHCLNLLKLLNNGNMKDFQKLPTIGPKMAYAIVLQRNLLGRFENWQQVKSLPIWAGSSWNRFVTYNCLNVLDTY